MIRISIEADTGADARRMLMELMGGTTLPPVATTYAGPVSEAPGTPVKAEPQPEPAEPAEEPKRRGRKPKSETAEPEPAPENAPAAETAESEPTVAEPVNAATVEDVRAVMQKIIGKFEGDEGPKTVFALLSEFGVKKASELTDEQRTRFVVKATDKLAA